MLVFNPLFHPIFEPPREDGDYMKKDKGFKGLIIALVISVLLLALGVAVYIESHKHAPGVAIYLWQDIKYPAFERGMKV